MDSPVGKIISINDRTATVEVERVAACPRCAAGRGCGAGLLSGSSKSALLDVSLAPGSRFRAGDEVTLTLAPAHLLRATLLVYGLPLAGTVLALIAGWLLLSPLSDAEAIASAIAGLAAGILAGRRQLKRRDCLQRFVPRIRGMADAAP